MPFTGFDQDSCSCKLGTVNFESFKVYFSHQVCKTLIPNALFASVNAFLLLLQHRKIIARRKKRVFFNLNDAKNFLVACAMRNSTVVHNLGIVAILLANKYVLINMSISSKQLCVWNRERKKRSGYLKEKAEP